MPDKRIVMRVEVIWVTSDPNDLVEHAFRQYDASPNPPPVEFIAEAVRMAAANYDWSIPSTEDTDRRQRMGQGFEVRVDGPGKWSVAFDDEDARADMEGNGPSGRHAGGDSLR